VLGCARNQTAVSAPVDTVRDVSTIVTQLTLVSDQVEAVGTVRAAETTQLASQVMGSIVRIHVQEGSRVSRGDLLIVLDDAQASAEVDRVSAMLKASETQLAAAKSDLQLAQSTLKRYQALFEKKSLSPQEFEEIKARVTIAEAHRDAALASQSAVQAALLQARSSLQYTQIRAPFDGIVTARLADPGTLATPGTPLLTIENPSSFRLEVPVNESEVGAIQVGGAATVVIDALGDQQIAGKVSQLVPSADPASRTVLVKISLPSRSSMRSGLFGRARFPRGQRQAIVVPTSALIQRGQLQGVYVVGADQMVGLRFVTLGQTSPQGVEILTGLGPGEHVIANAQGRELAGRKVEVQ
jgi:RND family efflux transporter MFP subunit